MVPNVPRLRHVLPSGQITETGEGIPVVATLTWHHGDRREVDAVAVAWTRTEVQVEWTSQWGDRRRDWVRAQDVRRTEDVPPQC